MIPLVILVDSNIPMYLIGAEHPLKSDARRLLDRSFAEGVPLVSDAEVFQEILHRYSAIRRPDAIRPAFQWLTEVTDTVFPIDLVDVERARDVLESESGLSARDALHVAVMRRHGVERILSFDARFDGVRGITRIWR